VIAALGITVKMELRALWFNTSAARDVFRWGLRNWERRRRRKIKFILILLSSMYIELRCTPLKKQVELVCLMGTVISVLGQATFGPYFTSDFSF
jgi:hypothetical protein